MLLIDISEDVVRLYFQNDTQEHIEFFDQPVFSNEKRRHLETEKKIKNFLQDQHLLDMNTAVCISAKNIFVKKTTFSVPKDENLEVYLQSYIIDNFPFNLQEITIEYLVLNSEPSPDATRMDVLVAAVPNYVVEKYTNHLLDLGIKPQILTLTSLCATRAYNQVAPFSSQSCLCIDFGSEKTDLIFIKSGELVFHRSVPTSGESIRQEIVDHYDASIDDLETIIRQIDLNSISQDSVFKIGPKEPVDVIQHLLETLITDIKRTISYYINNEQGESIDQIVVYGSYAHLKNIDQYLQESLNIKTIRFPQNENLLLQASISPSLLLNETIAYCATINLIGLKLLIRDDRFVNLLRGGHQPSRADHPPHIQRKLSVSREEIKLSMNVPGLSRLSVFFNRISTHLASINPLNFTQRHNPIYWGVFSLLIIAIYFLYLQVNIYVLTHKIEKNQLKLDGLNRQAEQLDNYKASLSQLSFSAPPTTMPFSKATLTQLLDICIKYKTNKQINFLRIEMGREQSDMHVIGEAADGSYIALFIKELQQSPNIRKADVAYITQKDAVLEFELLVTLKL